MIIDYIEKQRETMLDLTSSNVHSARIIEIRNHRLDIIDKLGEPNQYHNLELVIGVTSINTDSATQALRHFSGNERKYATSSSGRAQISLLKLGDDEAWNEIYQELNATDNNIRLGAFLKLGKVGSNRSVIALANHLSDFSIPTHNADQLTPNQSIWAGANYQPIAFYAAAGLSYSIEDGPTINTSSRELTELAVLEWQKWWQRNKHKYETVVAQEVEASASPFESLTNGEIEKLDTKTPNDIVSTPEQLQIRWLWLVGAVVVVGGVFLLRAKK